MGKVYKSRFAKYNALHKDKHKIGLQKWRASRYNEEKLTVE